MNLRVEGAVGWVAEFRKPTRDQYRKHRKKSNDPAYADNAQEDLCTDCVTMPRADWDKLLDRYPAIPEAAAPALTEACGQKAKAGVLPQALEPMLQSNPDVIVVSGDGWTAVYKPPGRLLYKMFRAKVHNPKQQSYASEELALGCIVHPPKDSPELATMLEDFPAFPDASAPIILEACGLERSAQEKC